MAKLTDTQLILLSTAAQRDDGAAVLPERMNRGSAIRAATALVARKFMREVRAKPGMPVWRIDENGRPLSLVILKAGRGAGLGPSPAGRSPAGRGRASPDFGTATSVIFPRFAPIGAL